MRGEHEYDNLYTEKMRKSKIVIWIGILASVLTVIGFVQVAINQVKQSDLSVSLNYHNREMIVGQCDTLIPAVKPDGNLVEYIWRSDNETTAMVSTTGVVRMLSEGSATITLVVKNKKGESVQASCLYLVRPKGWDKPVDEPKEEPKDTVQPAPVQPAAAQTASPAVQTTPATARNETAQRTPERSSRSQHSAVRTDILDLGYATYEGDVRDGQPHGNGTMTFLRSHVIPGTVDCSAFAGEKVIGSFRDGKINMGTWYRHNGTQALVKLGQKYEN